MTDGFRAEYTPAIMRLDRFLADKGWSQAQLAAEVRKHLPRGTKTHQTTINRLCTRKHRKASVQLALAIEAATDGAVRAEEVPLSRESRALLQQIRSGTGDEAAA